MMKQMNTIKRGAAVAIMAGLMGLAPVAANAAMITNLPEINKTYEVASSTQYNKDEVFKFVVEYSKYDAAGSSYTGEVKVNDKAIKIGNAQDVTIAAKNMTAANNTYTGKASFLNGYDFTQPGVYEFKVTETAGENHNIAYNVGNKTYVVKIVVHRTDDGQVVVKDVLFVDKGAGEKASNVAFTNGAAGHTTNQNQLTVDKKVSGTAANTEDPFTFTLTITGKATGSYDVVDQGGASLGTVTVGNPAKFTLKHGQSFAVVNLPIGASYTVTELANNYDDTLINGKKDDDRSITGTINEENNAVHYVNEKGFAPQTGITMNALPFVGIAVVAVAGGATLVISRKRRSGEEF